MALSTEALKDLRSLLLSEIGKEKTTSLTDEEVNEIGVFVLSLTSELIKGKLLVQVHQEPNKRQ